MSGIHDRYPEQQEEVDQVMECVVEEQRERYENVFDTEDAPWSYRVETHSSGPAVVLYSTEEDRPNAGGQFLNPLHEAGYRVTAVKDQASEDRGTRIFLEQEEQSSTMEPHEELYEVTVNNHDVDGNEEKHYAESEDELAATVKELAEDGGASFPNNIEIHRIARI